jgi:hypothetical protein
MELASFKIERTPFADPIAYFHLKIQVNVTTHQVYLKNGFRPKKAHTCPFHQNINICLLIAQDHITP